MEIDDEEARLERLAEQEEEVAKQREAEQRQKQAEKGKKAADAKLAREGENVKLACEEADAKSTCKEVPSVVNSDMTILKKRQGHTKTEKAEGMPQKRPWVEVSH